MSEIPGKHADLDPTGCRWNLISALAQPELTTLTQVGSASPEAAKAAYRLAKAVGYARLFGVALGDIDGTLPVAAAKAAAGLIRETATRGLEQLKTLDERLAQSLSSVEAEDAVCSLLETRMDVWAAYLAVMEAANAVVVSDPETDQLEAALDSTADAVLAFDAGLQAERALLIPATGTRLLENWRAMLASPHDEVLPWWLDGTIEAEAERADREAIADMPSPQAWAQLREGIRPLVASGSSVLPFPPLRPVLDPPRPAAAAATPGTGEPPPDRWWRSPEGQFLARLIEPARYSSLDDLVTLTFHDAPSLAPAVRLVDQPVWFRGVFATIVASDQTVFADFRRGDLSAAVSEKELAVGVEAVAWLVSEEGPCE